MCFQSFQTKQDNTSKTKISSVGYIPQYWFPREHKNRLSVKASSTAKIFVEIISSSQTWILTNRHQHKPTSTCTNTDVYTHTCVHKQFTKDSSTSPETMRKKKKVHDLRHFPPFFSLTDAVPYIRCKLTLTENKYFYQ